MAIRATILCENTAFGIDGALAEHGWSAWLETPAGALLFDTGSGRSLFNNAGLFAVPLETGGAILLRHHHNDHTGGLLEVVHVIRRGSARPRVPAHSRADDRGTPSVRFRPLWGGPLHGTEIGCPAPARVW
jgi:metal-dependent hydrolase (beta-lactamase superfamily II)